MAAFPTNGEFTVWPTTGSDNNGGGFLPGASGVDYSEQTTPQYALTGVTSSGSGNTVLTASAATDMVGNFGQGISGTNLVTGIYAVESVVAGVSITFGTNAAGGSIASGAIASGVINIGGALATVSKAEGASVINQKRIWIKDTGSYTVTATLTLSKDNNAGQPFTFEGYTTTKGDGGRITWTTSTNSVSLLTAQSCVGYCFKNIIISSTAGTRGNGVHTTNARSYNFSFENCVFDGLNLGINGNFAIDWDIQGLALTDCEFKNCVSHGCINDGFTTTHGCYFHDNGGDGFRLSTSDGLSKEGIVSRKSVFYGNTGVGLNVLSGAYNSNNFRFIDLDGSVFMANGSDGFKSQLSSGPFIVFTNNVLGDNGGDDVNILNQVPNVLVNRSNAYKSGGTNTNFPAGVGDVTWTVDPFTNAAGGDFTLNGTAGGGPVLQASGFESTILG